MIFFWRFRETRKEWYREGSHTSWDLWAPSTTLSVPWVQVSIQDQVATESQFLSLGSYCKQWSVYLYSVFGVDAIQHLLFQVKSPEGISLSISDLLTHRHLTKFLETNFLKELNQSSVPHILHPVNTIKESRIDIDLFNLRFLLKAIAIIVLNDWSLTTGSISYLKNFRFVLSNTRSLPLDSYI